METHEFFNKLNVRRCNFKNETFDFDIILNQSNFMEVNSLRFDDCVFNGKVILKEIRSILKFLIFSKCTFNYEVEIENCHFSDLELIGIKRLASLNVVGISIQQLTLRSIYELESEIIIHNSEIKSYLNFSELKIKKGSFKCLLNNDENDEIYPDIKFNNTNFYDF